MIRKFARRLLGGFREAGRRRLRELPAPEQMRKILERERTRAERSRAELSIVAFAAPADASTDDTLINVVEVLQTRLRTTDVLGRLDSHRVAVLLPGTATAGAWQVADNVLRNFPADVPAPQCQVYCFSSQDGTNGPDLFEQAEPSTTATREAAPMDALFLEPMPVWKRGVDLLGAIVGGIVLMPLLLSVAVAIKLTSPGPLLFCQQRSGRSGKKFTIYKFTSFARWWSTPNHKSKPWPR
jgi:hypothetical protein